MIMTLTGGGGYFTPYCAHTRILEIYAYSSFLNMPIKSYLLIFKLIKKMGFMVHKVLTEISSF